MSEPVTTSCLGWMCGASWARLACVSSEGLCPRRWSAQLLEGGPLLVVAGAERAEPGLQFSLRGCVEVAVAEERGEGGQFPDVAQDRVPVPGPDVVTVGGDERVAFVVCEAEPEGLEGGDEIDFPGAGADGVPVGEDDPAAVPEQVPAVGVAMDHPGSEREAELAVGVQELCAAAP